MNVLPASMQSRIMEHMDRLKTYKEVRDKVVTLSRNSEDAADIGNLDDSQAGGLLAAGEWGGWWQNENLGWHGPEPDEEAPADIQGLADIKRHLCGGMGRYARSCATPNPKGGGKGGKTGSYKGGPKGGPKGGKPQGKGGKSQQICPTCGKTGHGKERCWVTYPELQRKPAKKVQGVEGECNSVEMNGICIGALDCNWCPAGIICNSCPAGIGCNSCPAGIISDNDTVEVPWATVSHVSSRREFPQTTAASCSGT